MARPEKEPKTPLAHRLREVRRRLGDEERDLFAIRLDISKSALSLYERGERVPGPTVMATYRKNLGIDVNWLVTGEGAMFADPAKAPAPVLDQRLMRKLARIVDKAHKERNISDTRESVAGEAAELYNELRALVQNINDAEEVEAALPLLTLSYKRKLMKEFTNDNGRNEQSA